MTDLPGLKPDMQGSASLDVTDAHSAIALGSGSIRVFSTPMMIALMEAAAVDCVERHLPGGTTSLGTHLDVSHRAATPIGARVTASAVLTKIEGRTLTFALEARDAWEIVGSGTHTRAVVDRARFENKLSRKEV
jgi:predicted thioesterase